MKRLFVLLSIELIFVFSLFYNNEESSNSIVTQIIPIKNAEVPVGLNLSQVIKNNDEVFMVGKELVPGTYRVELTDTADTADIAYVEKYNSKEMGNDNLIAKYTFEENGYLIIEGDDVVVKLQGVKLTLQQNLYLFGF